MADAGAPIMPVIDANMPPLKPGSRVVSPFEFWPSDFFYIPVMAYAAYLSLRHGGFGLPSAANPGLPYGGLIGERKSLILGGATGEAAARIPPFITVDAPQNGGPESVADDALERMAANGIVLLAVAKPDIGCRGFGVQVIRSREELLGYISDFPRGLTFLLQEMADLPGEVGAYYIRRPGDQRGRILSLTLKYFPYVTGTGTHTLRQLIEADARAGKLFHLYEARLRDRLDEVLPKGRRLRLAFAGSHSKGTIFKNGTAYVTPAMERIVDRLVDGLPGYHIGRLDLRFDDFEALQRGEGDYRLIEANGAGGEPTEIWDAETTLPQAYRLLFTVVRELWEIGAANRARGAEMTDAWTLFKLYQREKKLWRSYPPTH